MSAQNIDNMPDDFTQQNRYLPIFNFRGYTQSRPLNYSTAIDPNVLKTEITGLSKRYDTGVNAVEAYKDSYYQNIKSAVGDLDDRNKYLSAYDSEIQMGLDKYKDERGRISYESPEFQRDMKEINRKFATDPVLDMFKATLDNYTDWDKKTKNADVVDLNPYYGIDGKPWNTKEKGIFYSKVSPVIDFSAAANKTWEIVKADVTKKSDFDYIKGLTTENEVKSNAEKIDKLVTDATDVFLQTEEGQAMLQELTTTHRKRGVYIEAKPLNEAMAEIKELIKSSGNLHKFTETTEKKTPWTTPSNIIPSTKKKIYDEEGKEIEVVTLPAGYPQDYTVSGNNFSSPYELQQNKGRYKKNMENIQKDFDKWSHDVGAFGKFVIVKDTAGNTLPYYKLKTPNKEDENKYGSQLLAYNYKLQLEYNKIEHAKKFDEIALNSVGLLNLSPDKIKENESNLALIRRNIVNSKMDGGDPNAAKYGELESVNFLLNNNEELYKKLQSLSNKFSIAEGKTKASSEKGIETLNKINSFLKERGMQPINNFSYLEDAINDQEILDAKNKQRWEVEEEQIRKNKEIDPKYVAYLNFYKEKAEDLNKSEDVYRFDVSRPTQESYAKNLKSTIESGILSGTMPIYLRQGEQNRMVDIDELKKIYSKAESGKDDNVKISNHFKLDGYAFDDDNGLIVVGSLLIGDEFQKVEIRDFKGLDSFLAEERFDVPIRLNLLKKLSEGFIESSNMESYVGVEYSKNGQVLQKAYKVEKLLFKEGAYEEGSLKVNFDGTVKYYDTYSDVIEGYFEHVAKAAELRQPIVHNGKTLAPRQQGVSAIDYNNFLGIVEKVDGVDYWVTYATPEEGKEASVSDLRGKLSGNSPIMKAKLGDNYLKTATIKDLVTVWAPPSDKRNRPEVYAQSVADSLGLSPTSLITNIKDVNALFKAMLKIENPTAYEKLYPNG